MLRDVTSVTTRRDRARRRPRGADHRRADGVPAPRAPRRRGRDVARGRQLRDDHDALDDGDRLARGGRRRRARRAALVPAVRLPRRRHHALDRRRGGRERLPGDRAHGRRAVLRPPRARHPHRLAHPRRAGVPALAAALGATVDHVGDGALQPHLAALSWRDVERIASGRDCRCSSRASSPPRMRPRRRARRGRRSSCRTTAGGSSTASPATIDTLPEVVDAVGGRAEVLLDGGIRRGADVVKALALGARAVLVGRPVLWGLAVDGDGRRASACSSCCATSSSSRWRSAAAPRRTTSRARTWPVRSEFLLDPEVVFLNHGSFGACPRPVFERYQALAARARAASRSSSSRGGWPSCSTRLARASAAYVGADAGATRLRPERYVGRQPRAALAPPASPGDEVLTTDLEYGACDLAWASVCERAGASYVRAEIPCRSSGRGDRRVAVRARDRTDARRVRQPHHLADRGRAPARADRRAGARRRLLDGRRRRPRARPAALDLGALGADFYAGNCHKWMCAPKGAGFLRVRPEWQDAVDGRSSAGGTARTRATRRETSGRARSIPPSYLAVPAAIDWMAEHDWPRVQERCRALLLDARERLVRARRRHPRRRPRSSRRWRAFGSHRRRRALKRRLYDEHRIEIPVFARQDRADAPRLDRGLHRGARGRRARRRASRGVSRGSPSPRARSGTRSRRRRARTPAPGRARCPSARSSVTAPRRRERRRRGH